MKKVKLILLILASLLIISISFKAIINNQDAKFLMKQEEVQEYLKAVYTPRNISETIQARNNAIIKKHFTEAAAERFFVINSNNELTQKDLQRTLTSTTYIGYASEQSDNLNKYKAEIQLVGNSKETPIRFTIYFYADKNGTVYDYKIIENTR